MHLCSNRPGQVAVNAVLGILSSGSPAPHITFPTLVIRCAFSSTEKFSPMISTYPKRGRKSVVFEGNRIRYPQSQLRHARDCFAFRWQKAVDTPSGYGNAHGDVIKKVHSLCRDWPVDLCMLNTETYPFLEDDKFIPPEHLMFSQSKRKNVSKKTKRRLDRSRMSDESVGQLVNPTKMGAAQRVKVSSLNPTTPSRGTQSEVEVQNSTAKFVYRCDGCDETGDFDTNKAAINHLIESGHSSCSQYRMSEVEEGLDIVSLVSPRCVAPPSTSQRRNFGWKADDVVVYCPSCRLIMPDKIICAHHYQIMHRSRKLHYALGRVLKASKLSIHPHEIKCEGCGVTLPDTSALASHWFRESPACSPFFLTFDVPLQVEFECLHCGLHRDHTILSKTSAPSTENKSNQISSEDINFYETMLSHLRDTHFAKMENSGLNRRFSFRFRVVQLEYGVEGEKALDVTGRKRTYPQLPKFAFNSSTARLRFSLAETEREFMLLCQFRGPNNRDFLKAGVRLELTRLKGVVHSDRSDKVN